MALVPCPECGRQISVQAEACPGCGHPTVEYRTVEVSVGYNEGKIGSGEEYLKRLRKEGWEVVGEDEEETETWENNRGEEAWFQKTTYKLKRSLLNSNSSPENAPRKILDF